MPPVSGPAWPILTVTTSSAGGGRRAAVAALAPPPSSVLPCRSRTAVTSAAATSVRPSLRDMFMEFLSGEVGRARLRRSGRAGSWDRAERRHDIRMDKCSRGESRNRLLLTYAPGAARQCERPARTRGAVAGGVSRSRPAAIRRLRLPRRTAAATDNSGLSRIGESGKGRAAASKQRRRRNRWRGDRCVASARRQGEVMGVRRHEAAHRRRGGRLLLVVGALAASIAMRAGEKSGRGPRRRQGAPVTLEFAPADLACGAKRGARSLAADLRNDAAGAPGHGQGEGLR